MYLVVTDTPGPCHDGPVTVQEVDLKAIDFAAAAWREEGRWVSSAMPARIATTVDSLVSALRQLPGENGVFGFVGVGDEFFLIFRVDAIGTRVFISDSVAVLDWSLAEEAADLIGLEWEEDDLEEFVPIGDLAILTDLGINVDEICLMVDESDMYPDDQVKAIAKRLGLGEQFDKALRAR
jgi:putative tRNA adenosine deaminase-associated protein